MIRFGTSLNPLASTRYINYALKASLMQQWVDLLAQQWRGQDIFPYQEGEGPDLCVSEISYGEEKI